MNEPVDPTPELQLPYIYAIGKSKIQNPKSIASVDVKSQEKLSLEN